MALYYIHAKPVRRSQGSSAVAAAAYRSAGRLYDERRERFYDFTKKVGVIHSEILTPKGQEHAAIDRGLLWNAVERREPMRNSQVAQEVTFALPREFGREQGLQLAREFVRDQMTEPGMIADLNVHWDPSRSGLPQPHAHVLLTTRRLLATAPSGRANAPALEFGLKVKAWTHRIQLIQWREALAETLNVRLAELGHEICLDHRSFKAQGVELEPQIKIGAAAARRHAQGQPADRVVQNEDIAGRNGDRILRNPALALNVLTLQHATFTRQDLSNFLERHTDDPAQFQTALAAVRRSSHIRALGRDRTGRERFTSLKRLALEAGMEALAQRLAARPPAMGAALEDPSFFASPFSLLVASDDGPKATALAAARQVWSRHNRLVQGLAPSEAMADRLASQAGLQAVSVGRAFVSSRRGGGVRAASVLVVDQASLLGTAILEMVFTQAERTGAQVVLIADPKHLSLCETGAAFRALAERHGVLDLETPGRWGPMAQHLQRRSGEIGEGSCAVDDDYIRRFAERRGFHGRAKHRSPVAEPATGWDERSVHRALRGYAHALTMTAQAQRLGRLPTDKERRALDRTAHRVASLWPDADRTFKAACAREPALLADAAAGGTQALLGAMEAGQERLLEERTTERWRDAARDGPGR